MIKNIHYIIYFTILACATVNAQSRKEKKASKQYDNFEFVNAISSFEELVLKGYDHLEIYKKLADANYSNGKYKEASKWYSELFAFENIAIDSELYYRYAQTLKSLKQYERSDDLMMQFANLKPEDNRSILFLSHSDYLDKIASNSGRYTLKELTINSSYSDIAPTMYAEELIFSTARDTGMFTKNIHTWDNQPFRNLYSAPIIENDSLGAPRPYSKILNTRGEESSTAFTADGKTIYFTRNNSTKKAFQRDGEGITNLKIFKATLVDSVWTDVVELPINGENFSTAHPSLNSDDSKLYFASDRPGTKGDSDIYVVAIKEDGTYGEPFNLGNEINTEARETFPYISDENILYFASDGHPGLGGLDVFAMNIDNEGSKNVMNVGEPVNSPNDDFGYTIHTESGFGYFASNRDGYGNDDIYSFKEDTPLDFKLETLLNGIVKDENDMTPLGMTEIFLFDENGEEIVEVKSNENGVYEITGDFHSGTYFLVADKPKYETYRDTLKLVNGKDIQNLEVLLRKITPANGDDLAEILNLEYPVLYFDFDDAAILPESAAILDKIVEYLNEYPNLAIEIGSHTDAKGSASYNLKLSNKRAENTLHYLLENGISGNRLRSKGFGETQLKNDCADWYACSEEENRLNRRSEFIVISTDQLLE